VSPSPNADSLGPSEVPVLLKTVRRAWRKLALATLAGASVMLLIVLLRASRYESHGIFVPQSRRAAPNGISGLAAQLGVAVTSDGVASPSFYAELLSGDELLGRAVDSLITEGADSTHTLADRLGAVGATSEQRREDAVRRLRRAVDASVNLKTGTVRVSVRLPNAELAANTVTRLLAVLNEMNVEFRQTTAAAEHHFAAERAAAVRLELAQAEERLRFFLQANRRYETSPELVLEYQRLQREVSRQESLLTTLLQMVEQARLDEVRDTPTVSLVERPRVPAWPDRSRDPFLVVLGAAVGAVLMAAWVLRQASRTIGSVN